MQPNFYKQDTNRNKVRLQQLQFNLQILTSSKGHMHHVGLFSLLLLFGILSSQASHIGKPDSNMGESNFIRKIQNQLTPSCLIRGNPGIRFGFSSINAKKFTQSHPWTFGRFFFSDVVVTGKSHCQLLDQHQSSLSITLHNFSFQLSCKQEGCSVRKIIA